MTRHVVVGTAGHIDHGKSALVRALTGTDPDRLKEEKDRGITIDLGFAHLVEGETSLAFVDVPGHERFVKNMLAGASGIDGVLLVVAADESVMPQTREHFDICRLLGVSSGVVALTKADLVDEETVELVRLETAELVAGSFLEGAQVLPVSARSGAGLDRLREALLAMSTQLPERTSHGAARLPIDRAFSVKGFGTVVTGTLVSGRLGVDETLELLPDRRAVKVRGLQVHGASGRVAVAGQRVAANLAGVEVSEIARGDTVVTPEAFEATTRIDGVLDLLSSARRLRHGARVRFHQGTSEILGRVALGPGLGPLAAADAPMAELPPGGRAFVRVRLERPAVLTRGDRFILRAYSPPLTIAGGQVLDPHPPRVGIRTASARDRFDRLFGDGSRSTATELDAASAMIAERGLAGVPVAELVPRMGVAPEASEAFAQEVVEAGVAREVAGVLVAEASLVAVAAQLVDLLTSFHASHPLSEGVPREEARDRLFRFTTPAVFESVVGGLVGEGRLRSSQYLALATHTVTLSPEEQRVSEAVREHLKRAGLRPPAPAALPAELGCDAEVLERIVKLLVRQDQVARVGALLFDGEALGSLKQDLQALKAGGDPVPIDVAMFKDRYGVTRKFAIPLLEYLDRERVTRRIGQHRVLL